MMKMIVAVFSYNYILTVSVIGWLAAQILKTAVYLVINKKFNAERMVGAGGWPSSHAALVCALIVSTGKLLGPASPIFALAAVLALVVMYDAMGVRREAGNQAKVINVLLKERLIEKHKRQEMGEEIDYFEEIGERLKEMIGHTPFQVVSGAILGTVLALLIPVF